MRLYINLALLLLLFIGLRSYLQYYTTVAYCIGLTHRLQSTSLHVRCFICVLRRTGTRYRWRHESTAASYSGQAQKSMGTYMKPSTRYCTCRCKKKLSTYLSTIRDSILQIAWQGNCIGCFENWRERCRRRAGWTHVEGIRQEARTGGYKTNGTESHSSVQIGR